LLEELDDVDAVNVSAGSGLIVHPSFEFQLGVTIPLTLVRRTRFRERFLADMPIAWIEDPATGALRPFWVRGEHISLLRSFNAGEPVRVSASRRLTRLLRLAGILVRPGEIERARADGEARVRTAAATFAADDYCLLSDLLHPQHVRALSRYYRELISEGSWHLGDAQVSGRYGWQNELLSRFFHHQLVAYVGRVVGEEVKPSYAYVSAYRQGAVLERHVDREQCEFTMSLLIDESPSDGSVEWPLFFDTPDGTVAVRQSIGEAVLFRGPKLPHYRRRLPDGQESTSLLFHYVPTAFRGTLY
jgi:hypothetical protein